jgi:hypothetical protein
LDLPYGVLHRLNPNVFSQAFTDWASQLVNLKKNMVAMDDKELRSKLGKVRKCPSLHLVNAWSVEHNLFLGQIKVSVKYNQITVITKLLAPLDIEGETMVC